MNIVLLLLVGFGLALDVFALAVAQGAVLRRVRLQGLGFMALIVCGWQILAVTLGYLFSRIPHVEDNDLGVQMIWSLVAATIFAAIGGIKLFYLHFKPEIPEARGEFDFKRIFKIGASISVYTFFAGIACGLLLIRPLAVELMMFLMSLGLVIGGVYVGYRRGSGHKGIYYSGGGVLVLVGAMMLARYFIWLLL